MTMVKTLVTAVVVWLVSLVAPKLLDFGLSQELIDSISLVLQTGLFALVVAVATLIGKKTGLTEPAALIVAAIEADMPNASNPIKKAEAILRLNIYIDQTVTNPILNMALKWGAGSAIEHALPMAKTLLNLPPVKKP